MKPSKAFLKKSLSLMLASAVAFNSAATVFAEGEAAPSQEMGTAQLPGIDLGITNDELLFGYFENGIYGVGGGATTYTAIADERLGTGQQDIYNQVLDKAKYVSTGQSASTDFEVKNIELTFTELGISSSASNAEIEAAISKILNNVYQALLFDNPFDFYWHDKTNSGGIAISYYTSTSATAVTLTSATISFVVDINYRATEADKYNTSDSTARVNAAIGNAQEIFQQYEGASVVERLEGYKDAICELVSYDDNAVKAGYSIATEGFDPWQLINVFDGNTSTNVVCEGYSKAFEYLCDLSGDTCYCVTGEMTGGTGSGPHMWNIVTIGGTNYLVDVTNCDEGTVGAPDRLFLKGMTEDSAAVQYSKKFDELNSVIFTYDSDTISYYGNSILTVSTADYTPSAVTFDIADAIISQSNYPIYDNTEYSPEFTVKYNGEKLTEDTDYTVEYTPQTNAGTYEATIKGIDKYSGSKVVNWTINPTPIYIYEAGGVSQETAAYIYIDETEFNYTGDPITPEFTIKLLNYTLIPDTDYVLSGDIEKTDAGTYTLTVEGKGNFGDTTYIEWTIYKSSPEFTPPEPKENLIANGSPQELITAGSTTGGTMMYKVNDGEYSAEIPTATEAGTYTVYYKVEGGTNYNSIAEDSFEVTVSSNEITLTDEMIENDIGYGEFWERDASDFILKEGFIFDITATERIPNSVINYGTIRSGECKYMINYGTITGGTFECVDNLGTVTGGTFEIFYNHESGTIDLSKGGTVNITETGTDEGKIINQDGTVHTHELTTTYDDVTYEKHDIKVFCEDCPVKYVKEHITYQPHTLTAKASDNKVIVSCECDFEAVVTLNGPENAVYDGAEKNATTDIDANAQALSDFYTIFVSDITYRDSTNTLLNSAPVNVGTYEAELTVSMDGTGTAVRKTFTIEEKTPTASFTFADNLAYNGEAQNLVKSAEVTGGTAYYSLDGNKYTTTIPTATDAGEYTVYYKVVGDTNYKNLEPQTVKITVSPYIINQGTQFTVQSIGELIYNGKEQTKITGATFMYTQLTEGEDYTLSGDIAAENPGNYTVTITGIGNFTGVINKNYTIEQRELIITPLDQNVVQNGTPNPEKIEVSDLINGHKVIVTFKNGDYSTIGDEVILEIDTGTIQDTEGKDVTAYYNVTHSATATATVIEHTHEYTITASGDTITAICKDTDGGCPRKTQTVKVTAAENLVYDGYSKSVDIEGTIDGVEITLSYCDADGKTLASSPTNAGTYSAEISAGDVTASTTFKIEPRSIENAVITGCSAVYNGNSISPDVITVVLDGEYLYRYEDFEIAFTPEDNQTNAGTYPVTVKGIGNYTGEAKSEWSITPTDITGINFINPDIEIILTKTYDGKTEFNNSNIASIEFLNGSTKVLVNDFIYGTDYTATFTADSADAGGDKTVKAVITFLTDDIKKCFKQESYTFTLTQKGVINPAKATVSSPPAANELTYDGEAHALVTEGEANGGTFAYRLSENESYSNTIPELTDAGTYIVYYCVKPDTNHTESESGSVAVTIKPKNITYTVDNAEKVYGDTDPVFTGIATGIVGTDELAFTFTREEGANAGTYKITAELTGGTDKDNYTVTVTDGTLTIKQADPNLVPVPQPVASTITYGMKLSESTFDSGWRWVDDTIVPGVNDKCKAYHVVDDVNYDYSRVEGYDAELHAIVENALITIEKAELTITADDKYIIVGAELPETTYTAKGFVGNDKLVTEPVIGYSGADNITIGEYDIVITKEADAGDNYTVTHKNGTLYVGLCDHEGTTEILYDSDSHWKHCTKCGQDNMDDIEHSGGTATCTKQAVCETCKIPYGKALGHNWTDFLIQNDTHHWHDCQNADCPITEVANKDGYGAHTYGEWTVVKPATKTEKGLKERTCSECKYTDEEVIPLLESGEVPEETTPATPAPETTTTTSPVNPGIPSWVTSPSVTTTPASTTTTTAPATEDDEDDSLAPQIKDENGKMGWEAITDEILDAKEGEKVIVDMNGATKVPKEIFEQAMGQNIEIVIELENGFKWTINGEDITKPMDIDLGVNEGADNIPVMIINEVTGGCDYTEITLSHDGDFGFTAVLTIDAGEENEGFYANLYYYVDAGLDFICADKISSKGMADLTFTHASEYIIVIDNENHGKRTEESTDSDVDGNKDEVITDDEEEDNNPFTAVTLSFTGVIVSAAAAILSRKRKQK